MVKKSKKAQASVEFLSMVGLMIVIFLGIFLFTNFQNISASEFSIKLDMQSRCNEISTAINLAYSGGSGFITYVVLPNEIKGGGYKITFSNKTIYITSGSGLNKKVVFCRVLTSNINGTIGKGKIKFENINETIYIR